MFAITINIDPDKLKEGEKKEDKPKKTVSKARKGRSERKTDDNKDKDSES